MGKTLCDDGTTRALGAASDGPSAPVEADLAPPAPEPAAAPQAPALPADDPDPLLAALLDDLNVDETLDLVASGEHTAAEVLAAERARERPRKTVVDALTAITEQE